MSKIVKLDVNGNVIDDDVRTLKDGQRLRVNVTLMDNAELSLAIIDAARGASADNGLVSLVGHRPGYMPSGDVRDQLAATEREVRRDLRKEKLSDQWRHPPALIDQAKPVAPIVADSEAAAQRRDARLERAWVHAGAV